MDNNVNFWNTTQVTILLEYLPIGMFNAMSRVNKNCNGLLKNVNYMAVMSDLSKKYKIGCDKWLRESNIIEIQIAHYYNNLINEDLIIDDKRKFEIMKALLPIYFKIYNIVNIERYGTGYTIDKFLIKYIEDNSDDFFETMCASFKYTNRVKTPPLYYFMKMYHETKSAEKNVMSDIPIMTKERILKIQTIQQRNEKIKNESIEPDFPQIIDRMKEQIENRQFRLDKNNISDKISQYERNWRNKYSSNDINDTNEINEMLDDELESIDIEHLYLIENAEDYIKDEIYKEYIELSDYI
jgi:hypothetical protein